MASCTSDNDFDNTPSPDDWSNTVTNSNVEIKLGTGSNGTRSSLGDANGLFAANGLGVFCLAKDKLSDDTKLIEINWSRLNESTKNYSLWMDNVKTNATINGDVTELSWAYHTTRWYPIGNWHRYSFYGYYPRVEDKNITTSQTKITAKITINGTQDVIWGKADPDPAEKPYAYSGYYFRQPGNDEDIPVLQFEHKLMRLDFYVKAAPDAKGSTANAKNMGVREIAVKDVPYVGTLTIAHKTSDPNICEDGKLTFESVPNYWCPLKFFACNKIRLNPSLGIQPFLLPLFSPQKTSNMNKGTHFNGQPMYGQLLNLLDRSKILRFSRESGGERYVKHFDAWQHLVIMLYAVIKRFDSLREITDSMFPEARKLAHLGINLMPRRSTLSDANSRRKECVFEAVYRDLYATYRDELSSDSRRKQVPEWLKRLQIIDSTTITLFSNLIFKGAGRNPKTGKKKGGIKVHANIHANEGVPSDIRFTSAATNDSFMLRPSNYACGDIVALDRAYIDYAKFEELTRREVIYVTKMKKNLVFDTVSDTMYMHPEGLMECRVQHVIFHKHVKDGEDIEHHARIITYVDIKNGKARLVSLLTNDMNMEVEDIVGIYRKRWEIELLFKQLKQNFPLRYFYGESANAIKIQIWVTLIANLLLMVMQRRIKRSWSFSNLATMFRIMLMYYVNCYTFFEHPERDWLKIIEMDNPQPDEPALFD